MNSENHHNQHKHQNRHDNKHHSSQVNSHRTNHHIHSKKRRKLGLFYGSTISLLLIAFMVLFYFLVLVSSKPKSIPFVTQKIQEVVDDNFGSDSSLEQSYIGFTRYGTIKVSATNIKIFYIANLGNEKKTFLVPRLETEFSLLDILFLNFKPNKIRLISPDIVIDDLANFKPSKEEEKSKESQIAILLNFFSNLQKNNSTIEFIEIEDGSLTFRTKDLEQKILLKKSQIHLLTKGDVLHIMAQNQLSFDAQKKDVDFDFDCQMSQNSEPRCDATLTNFSFDSISDFHSSIKNFEKISGLFDVSASLNLKGGNLENISFNFKAEKGVLKFLESFAKELEFKNLNLSGSYNYQTKALNISDLKSDLASSDKSEDWAHLTMSLNIDNLGFANESSNYLIKLNNVLGDDLARFWPLGLDDEIRSWVEEHIDGGIVKEAVTQFSLSKSDGEYNLSKISADINFIGLNLAYDKNFPEIYNISGKAQFSEKGMKIAVAEANLLQSKISDTSVVIDDFLAPNVMLKISGKVKGKAFDTLKHATGDRQFHQKIEKYLNGIAQTNVEIQLSLSDEITLRNSYIAVDSIVNDLDSQYYRGAAIIRTKKDFNSSAFVSSINLDATEISAKAFDVVKKPFVEANLDFVLVVDRNDDIRIKNILLVSKDVGNEKNKEKNLGKISGNIFIKTSPFLLSQLNLANDNFGKNNYNFSYRQDNKNSPKTISLQAKQINLGAFIENKFFHQFENDPSEFTIKASIFRANLLRNKFLQNAVVKLSCENICTSGLIKASYGNKQLLNFLISKAPKNDFSTIEGRVSDVGYLAEGFGISNLVSGGDANLKLKNKMVNDKPILEGEVNLKDKIIIYENATVKRLAKDTLFSSVKDKIFSSEKTIFDSLKLEFDISSDVLNIHSLIANNYKIGITAKGVINLKSDAYNLKGMIVPGFIINNLFGLGNIPVLGSLLTGGEGGGVFGIRYEYVKEKNDKEGKFTTNKVASFVPSSISNLFD